MRRFMIGVTAGFLLGYTAARTWEAWSDLRRPREPLEKNPRAYGATKRALMVAGVARSLAGHALIAALCEQLPTRARSFDRPAATAAFTAAGMLLDAVIDTPIDYVERHLIERRYDLTDQSGAEWLRERGKMTAVNMAIATPVVTALLFAAQRFERTWPLLASAAAPPLLAFLSLVAPVYIAPVFNKFEPLHGPLEERLRALAARYGVGDADIMRFDMSKQTKKANAYVAGLLGTHRIAIADTLLDNFTDDEIEFVVAHELGHYVAKDTWIGVGAGSLAIAMLINVANALARRSGEAVTSIAGFARFGFLVQLLATAAGPLLAAGSRAIERRADRFALAATNQPAWGIAAFRRLREQNLAEDEQPRWAEILISTHPSLRSRIEVLQAAPGYRSNGSTSDHISPAIASHS